jgi:hypothetical protein
MIKIIKNHRKRFIFDCCLLLASILPAIISFYSDYQSLTKDLFIRSGAIMALFAAFLEFKTHEIKYLQERDNFHRIWSTISIVTEGLAKVDSAAKYSIRQISTIIESAGMEPDIGRASEIKDMVVSNQIKALKYLPIMPEYYYKYSAAMALFGKCLVVSGTLIWAFGDKLILLTKT